MDPKALYNLSYGVYVVTAKKEGRLNGQIANTVFQISSEPPTIAVSINKQNLTYEFIRDNGIFAVSVLAKEAPLSLIGQFGFKSGREVDKFAGISYKLTPAGLPYLTEHTLAYLEARVTSSLDVHTRTVFIGTLTEAEMLRQGEPMTYAYYHQVKRGTTPKTAPTFVPAMASTQIPTAPQYRCTICNYIYDPAKGDPEHGVAPGTTFDQLPEDWSCPICGAGKEAFEVVS
ncbi:Rubredoxin/NADH-FMN oxidoreductase RutF, flavin reductase (DIM6/NTAB) family [Thermanaeromonas toyohensis ToBE]|uniref:Rubredoxin/NADH-FMN oxidoreductase RutF, flavin reductase (DIM6/NTAB) family n=1 Tax=Thermanaeromonas toyohensis ToBE TaxID=698762 RepID=A0A1W1VNL9_9FIRM|nr:Rubredoxin/NADH-FMN oxidoreductase RutF, flavin reductase (DIM6/NTAB) family [Thermanaeromonas toyohensis ToBE]